MQDKKDEERRVRSSIENTVTKYEERSPYFLNPDKVVFENIIEGLVRNQFKYGYRFCPCRKVIGIPEVDRRNICPCDAHKKEIAFQGTCECGLFVSKAYYNEKRKSNRKK